MNTEPISQTVDLTMMSEALGVPPLHLKLALKLPVEGSCPASTVTEARRIYNAAPDDSDIAYFALHRWDTLSLADLVRATSIETIRLVHESAPPDGLAEHKAFEQWDILSLQVVRSATSLEAITDAFFAAPIGGKARHQALLSWAQLAQTSLEIQDAYDNATNDDSALRVILNHWEVISKREVRQSTLVQDIRIAHSNSPKHGQARLEALYRWIDLSCSLDEAQEAFRLIPESNCEERSEGIRRIARFFPTQQ